MSLRDCIEQLVEAAHQGSINLVDVLAAERGWKPLTPYEEMTITINEKRYIIVRLEDIEE